MLKLLLLTTLVSVTLCLPQQKVKVMNAQEIDITLRFEQEATEPEDSNSVDVNQVKWTAFKEKYGKIYKSKEEEELRREIYETNLKKIELINFLHVKGLKSFTAGENKYSDMEHSEFVRVMNGYKPPLNKTLKGRRSYLKPLVPMDVPDEFDWRTQGYVTDVKDQGQCGSCWAFSSTGALEGQMMRATGQLVPLSEQNLVDCSQDWGNNGCNGGWMDNAFQYISDNGGLDTEDCYPYEAIDDSCRYSPDCAFGHDSGFTDLPEGDEDTLKEMVASVGPIAVAIDASDPDFMQYQGGYIYNNPDCGTQLDHAVLVVGYGTSDQGDYWIVKNSWSSGWGDGGYIYMARNQGNQCGIASAASYPNV